MSLLLLVLGLAGTTGLAAQEITTATSFFNAVAERYAGVRDFSADVTMQIDDTKMSGKLEYKRPSRLRVDFTQPDKQVIVSDGQVLKVYIPRYDVTLLQQFDSGAGSVGMASQEGLALLRKGFNIAYKTGPAAVPLDGSSGEQVTKLLLTWKNTNQGFREIELSVTQGRFIRRITGITADHKKVRIDYTGLQVNQGIPDTRFDYDSPASSNTYDNFLFGNQ